MFLVADLCQSPLPPARFQVGRKVRLDAPTNYLRTCQSHSRLRIVTESTSGVKASCRMNPTRGIRPAIRCRQPTPTLAQREMNVTCVAHMARLKHSGSTWLGDLQISTFRGNFLPFGKLLDTSYICPSAKGSNGGSTNSTTFSPSGRIMPSSETSSFSTPSSAEASRSWL
jgi:hypothetical protein